ASARTHVLHRGSNVQRAQSHGRDADCRGAPREEEALLEDEERRGDARAVAAAVERGQHHEVPEVSDGGLALAMAPKPVAEWLAIQRVTFLDRDAIDLQKQPRNPCAIAQPEVSVARERRPEMQRRGKGRGCEVAPPALRIEDWRAQPALPPGQPER